MKYKIVIGYFILGVSSLLAEETKLSIDRAEQLALENDPEIQALLARADAYEHLAEANLKLPDVQIRLGLMNYPLEHGNFRTEGMTHSIVGVRQMIPPRGLRPALAEKNTHLARALDVQSANHAKEVTRQVRYAWLDVYYYQRKLKLNQTAHSLFEDLLHLARTLYSTGDGSKHDILQIELEQFKIEDRLLEIEQKREHAHIALGEFLGLEESFELSKQLPNWNSVPPTQTLHAALSKHPQLIAISARANASEAQRRAEESNLNREWAIDLSYGYRDGGLLSGASRSDLVSASVSFNLPLWGKQKYLQKIEMVKKEHSATLLEQESTHRKLRTRLERAQQHWTTLNSRLELYERQILPKVEEQVTVTMESYENQAIELPKVLQSYLGKIEAQVIHLRLNVDRLKVWADIDELVSIDEL